MGLMIVSHKIVHKMYRVIHCEPDSDTSDQQCEHIQRYICDIHNEQPEDNRCEVGDHTEQSQTY